MSTTEKPSGSSPDHELVLVFCRETPYTYHPQKVPGPPYKQRTQKPRTNTAYGRFEAPDTRPNAEVSDRYPGSILTYPSPRQQDLVHPTQKPVPLADHLIRSYSNPGEVVLDPCMGSGTTGKAAQVAGRHFVGIETKNDYFLQASIDIRTLQKTTPPIPEVTRP